ncbi:tRNA pseudouridine(55) synthase TruB [Aliterella atlantica]|uniref:tRNA pseudouridine synthase B n=1 Tax=Aliterella atlantica CENA595 TaxID=1618023 RepID=A0A0D8ZUY2_9CYAN|nr:tRNA pseudouridine(55) synthase TruB [Aliterella atlantica]KJH72550.1 tRNA pseudouridine synthase B [Aliterella atlantica CENA595]
MQGFINLDKQAGFTSHDCVALVRKNLRLKRVGHGGTLDPTATGVLPIALGKATRLLQYLQTNKAYQATIRLGVVTTTDDLAGEVIASQPVNGVELTQVSAALKQFTGKIKQIPPKYSAIQVEGKRLYDLARSGKEIEVPTRIVEVFKIEILDWRGGDYPEIDVAIACGAGTYIRAIARDLGMILQTGGTLAALRRTQSSGFNISDSITLDQLKEQLQQGSFNPITSETALQHLPSISLPTNLAQKWCQGQQIVCQDKVLTNSPLQVYREDGCFLGIGHLNSDTERLLIPDMVFEAQ